MSSVSMTEKATDCYVAALKMLRLITTQIVTSFEESDDENLDKSMFDILFTELRRSIKHLEEDNHFMKDDTDCQQLVSGVTKFEPSRVGLVIDEVISGVGEYSIVFWINITSLVDGFNTIFHRGTSEVYTAIGVNADLKFQFYHCGSKNVNVESTSIIQTKLWYHVACVHSNEKIVIYVNGVKENQNDAPGIPAISYLEQPVKIGKSKNPETKSFDSGFNGLLSDVRYSKRAFEVEEISLLVNDGPTFERSDDYCNELLSLLFTVRNTDLAQDILCTENTILILTKIIGAGSLRTQTTCLKLLRVILVNTDVDENLQQGVFSLLFEIMRNALDFRKKSNRAEHRGHYCYSIVNEIVMLIRTLMSSDKWNSSIDQYLQNLMQFDRENPINFDIMSVLHILGGGSDVLRVGGRATIDNDPVSIIMYKFSAGSSTVMYEKPDPKPVLVDTDSLKPIEEISFNPSLLSSYQQYNDIIKYCSDPELVGGDQRLFKLALRSNALFSLQKIVSVDNDFIASPQLFNILGDLSAQPMSYKPNLKKLEEICTSLWKRMFYLRENELEPSISEPQPDYQVDTLVEILRSQFPELSDSKLILAIKSANYDLDTAANLINELISTSTIDEIMYRTRAKYPVSWVEQGLTENNQNVEDTIKWLKENQLSLIQAEPDLMFHMNGNEIYSHPFLDKGLRKESISETDEEDDLPPFLDMENVILLLEEFETARSVLYARKILVSFLKKKMDGALVEGLFFEHLVPYQVSDILHVLTCRGNDEITELMDTLIRIICTSEHPSAQPVIEYLVDDCSTHLVRIATSNVKTLTQLNTSVIDDLTLLLSPRIIMAQWLFSTLLKYNAFQQKERLDRLFIWMTEVIRSPLIPIKHIVFNLMKRLFISLHLDSLDYFYSIDLDRIILLAEERIRKELRDGVAFLFSTYVTSLLNLVGTVKYIKDQHDIINGVVTLGINITAVGTDFIELEWTKNTEELVFILEMNIENNSKVIYNGPLQRFRVKSLNPATEYSFRLTSTDQKTEHKSDIYYISTNGTKLNKFEFSEEATSPNVLIDREENSITKLEGSYYDCVLLNTELRDRGVYYFEILVNESGLQQFKNGNIWIGVVDQAKFTDNAPCGWGIMNFRISKDCDLNKTRNFGEHFGTNNIMGVLVDLDSFTLQFWKDGKYMGYGFLQSLDMKDKKLSIVLGINDVQNQMTLLENNFEIPSASPRSILNDCIIFQEILLTISNQDPFPRSILEDIFFSLQKWLKNNTRMIKVRGQYPLELSLHSTIFDDFSFSINSIMNTPNGPAKLLGYHGDMVWFLPVSGELRDPMFWSCQEVSRDIVMFSIIEEKENNDLPHDELIKFSEFCDYIHDIWNQEQYVQIVETINKLESSNLTAFDIPPQLFLEEIDLPGTQPAKILAKAAFLRYMNMKGASILPMSSMRHLEDWRLGSLINNWKFILFYSTKRSYFNDLVFRSQFFPLLPDDEYSDPEHLPQIEIDRSLASSAYYSSDVSKRARKSVFGQLYTKLVNEKRYEWVRLRQHFVGNLDGGQARSFRVKLSNEGVYDNGGPYREVFLQCCTELQSPDILPLLLPTPNQTGQVGANQDKFIINPGQTSLLSQRLYGFLGRIIGICLRCEISLPLNFSSTIWKKFLNETVDVSDILRDDQFFANLISDIRNCEESEWDGLYKNVLFWTVLNANGVTKELCENGSSIGVTWEERELFIKKTIEFKISEGEEQCKHILEGLGSIIPIESISIFSWRELETLVCGNPYFDVSELKENTVYEGVSEEDPHVQYFWEFLENLDKSKHEDFLRFSWARSRMPSSDTPPIFKIQYPPPGSQSNPDSHLPTAQTCFFSISLPRYTSKETAEEKILYAIENCVDMDNDFHV